MNRLIRDEIKSMTAFLSRGARAFSSGYEYQRRAAVEAARLLVRIRFYQHERLIHLLVTILFALLFFSSFCVILFVTEWFLIVINVLMLILLVPYIFHYFALENGVQKLYEIYDQLIRIAEEFHA
ncbi:MAG: hypothetical protein GXY06_06535 [Clostridiaceae bacterium]|nr:hypothetical protein [Clostridiaceae bacterium]